MIPSPPPISTAQSPFSPEDSAPRWRRWLFDYAPPLVMMLVIFIASTDVGSTGRSGAIVRQVLAWMGLAQRITPPQLEALNHYLRKLGHLTEYAILAGLLHRAVIAAPRSARSWAARWAFRTILTVLALVTLYAATDEFHQRFVATRTPSVWDVLLDTIGGGVGLAIKRAWEGKWKRRPSG